MASGSEARPQVGSIDEDNMVKDLILRNLYYSPKTGFRSAAHIHELAIKENPDISLSYVKRWLQHQATYSRHKKYNSPRHYRHTFVRDIGEQVQMDLVTFLAKHSSENEDYKYFLSVFDILSRYAFAYPIRTKVCL